MKNLLFALVIPVSLVACDQAAPEPETSSKNRAASTAKPELVPIPPDTQSGRALIQAELARAEKDGVKLVVYVGATWCEPCQAFHKALEAGQLDAELAGVRFLDFDHDVHGSLLADAKCGSKMIPLFARAESDGTCGARRTEGGIKGDGAVAFMMPKLNAILRN